MDEMFQWSEFGSGGGVRDPDFHFASLHSPGLKFDYIKKSENSLDEGLSEFDKSQRECVRSYSSVSIFRDVMEYIEEFGVYLYSILDPDVGFVDAITRTETSEVKDMFTNLRDREYGDILDMRSEDFDSFDDFLCWAFGYDVVLENSNKLEDRFEDDIELTVGDKHDAVETSITVLKDKLERISWFFLYFDEAYNAVKHGNRVTIQESSGFELELEQEERQHQIDIDEPFAEFLCKISGDKGTGKRYIFSAPINELREFSVATANDTRDLYSSLYQVSQTIRESKRSEPDEEFSVDVSFFGIHETEDRENSYSYTKVENPDSSIWLPDDVVPEEMKEDQSNVNKSFYAGFEEQNGGLIMKTVGKNSPTFEYPIQVEGTMASDNDRIVGWKGEFNFNFRVSQLPLWQYKELLALKEESPHDSITVEHPEKSISQKQSLNREISLPDVPKPEYWDLLEFAYRVHLASDTNLFYPVFLYNEAAEVLAKYQEKELTRDVAKRCLRELVAATTDYVYTEVVVSILDSTQRTEDGYKKIESEVIRSVPGAYVVENDGDEIQDISIEKAYPDSFNRQDSGHVEGLAIMLVEESERVAFQILSSGGLASINELTQAADQDDSNSCISINRDHGIATHWYWFDKLRINIYSGIPPHATESVERFYT